VVAAVLDRERRRHLLAPVADHLGQRPELLLLLRRHPALDEDVLWVLFCGGFVSFEIVPCARKPG